MRIDDKYSKKSSPESSNNNNISIHGCAELGDLVGLVRLLVSNPSLLNQKSVLMAQTPLHVSCIHNKVEVLKYLLDWTGIGSVEIEARNVYGETPLHLAAKNGSNDATKMLLDHGAYIEAKTNNSLTALHLAVGYALQSGNILTVKILLEYKADCFAQDGEGKIPPQYIPDSSENRDLSGLMKQYYDTSDNVMKAKMFEFNNELSNIVGLHELKKQLQMWAKGMLLDEKRRAMGLNLGPRKPPHMAFLGNPGTGKTTVARILGKLLKSVGVLSSDKVTEVQRTDLVAEFIGQTGPKTKKKIVEAMGGILFVDEAYRLVPEQTSHNDFGIEALEEIMSVLEDGNLVLIFAGYTEPMKRVFSSNQGFCRRVTHFFQFDDFTCRDLAQMLILKMTKQGQGSRLYGFKLHYSCTFDEVLKVIESNSSEKLRNKMNGGLVDHMLTYARENLDSRVTFDCEGDELLTITVNDLEAGLKLLAQRVSVE